MMSPKSVWLMLMKPFAKPSENQPENQLVARLATKNPSPYKKIEKPTAQELNKAMASEQGTDIWYRETKSTKEKAPLQSGEVGNTRNRQAADDDDDDDDDDLNCDRKKLHRLQILNSRLISELADAKLSEKWYLQEYEKERNARELVTKKLEALKRESEYMREGFEREIKSIRTAGNWQQCALEMKLEEARLILEGKYDELDDLRAQLEALRNINCANDATNAVKEDYMKDYM